VTRAALLASALLLLAAVPAAAHWNAPGAGTGQAPVNTLPGGNQPVASASLDTVTVQWTQSDFEGSRLGGYAGGGYVVRRYPAGGGPAVTPNGGCGTTTGGTTAMLSCDETGVPSGSWKYTVTPVLGSWTGAESSTSGSVTVLLGAPDLTSVTAQNPAAGQATGAVQLAWGATTGATGYNVYRRTSSGSYDYSAPLNGAVPVTSTSYADPGSGLTGGSTYAYVVRAVRAAVESADSNERSATPIARPAAPAGLTATPAAGGRIDVAWSSVSDAAGYNVYRRTSTGSYDYSAPLNGATPTTATSLGDTATADGTTYRYVVRAVGTGAGGTPLESFDSGESAAATADATAPSAVTIADPGSPLRGTVTLAGTAADSGSGVASVRLQYAPAGGSTWTTGCTATTAPYSCGLATTALADGLYDLRALATDVAGNTTASSVVANRRIDNTGPSVTMADPGAFLRATVTLTASATDAGSGVASVRIQRAPAGSSTWTDVCTVTSGPYGCPLNTATLTDGGYDLRAIATDAAGNASTSALVSNRVVDNTAPTAVDIQTTNASGGTAGKPEAGDVLTYTFSEPMRPESILAGWTGAATPVVVRIANGNPDVISVFDATNTTQLALGTVKSGKKYVTASTTFTASSIVLGGNTISVTLGTPSGATTTANGTTTLQWTVSTAATDRAGNALTAATVLETGAADLDF
jgi:fibronectin type 3 domain-containing protein